MQEEVIELSEQAGRVIGALLSAGHDLMPSEFVSKFDFTEPKLERDMNPKTTAVLNFDIGVRECEERGLVEWYYTPAYAKRFRLTAAGKALVE